MYRRRWHKNTQEGGTHGTQQQEHQPQHKHNED